MGQRGSHGEMCIGLVGDGITLTLTLSQRERGLSVTFLAALLVYIPLLALGERERIPNLVFR